ncbi:WhiB family transcriptional regulator [Streptomyces violaceorubidus]|uniref:Transcriptional regulator WhiB n=1 Tax=Streptomyces violaceorubidus TaxID=284042 RepID=A0ABV1T217_9ACTN|nr:WhiB family transcriptional regulator [Streptomyces violaceorubidus]
MYRDFLTGDWQTRSACRGEDPELFFPVGDSGPALLQAADAKAVCRLCSVTEACLRWAMDAGEVHGIWGGTDEGDRRLIRRGAARAAAASRTADV